MIRRKEKVELGEPPALAELSAWVADGVREVWLPLHGAHADVHDWVAGQEGAFDTTMRALGAARSLGLRTTVVTRVTRSNVRVLADVPRLLRARGVAGWAVRFPTYSDEASMTGAAPRLSLAVPPALAALDRGRRLGLAVSIEGAPACMLGPMTSLLVPSPPRSHPEPCQRCALRDRCSGVDEAYVARFGVGELRPH